MSMLWSAVLTLLGLGVLGATIPRHWRQFRPHAELNVAAAIVMRLAGAGLLAGSLWLCLGASHPTIGVLVWVMELALGAVLVALFFAFCLARP